LAKPPKQTQPGWFSFWSQSENHPGLAGKRMLRGIFWIAQPPLITEPPNGNLVDASFGNLVVETSTFDIVQQAI